MVCSIWPKGRTILGATTPGQSEPGRNGNEEVLCIPQSSKAGSSPSDCLMSYLGHLLKGELLQSVYSTAPANWAEFRFYYYLHIAGRRWERVITFQKAVVRSEMQTVLSRIELSSSSPFAMTKTIMPCILIWNFITVQIICIKNSYLKLSSSSSYRAGSTDIPDPLSPLLPIVHHPR